MSESFRFAVNNRLKMRCTEFLDDQLRQMHGGNFRARNRLVEYCLDRVRDLARKRLGVWPVVEDSATAHLQRFFATYELPDLMSFLVIAKECIKLAIGELVLDKPPGQRHLNTVQWRSIQECVAELPERTRQIWEFRFYTNLQHDEIASILCISIDQSDQRYRQAKMAIQAALDATDV